MPSSPLLLRAGRRGRGAHGTAIGVETATYDLRALLRNRRWVRRFDPFPHVTATDVFVPSFYAELEGAFRELLSRGLSDGPSFHRMSRSSEAYGAYVYNLSRARSTALGIFASRAWHDVIAAATGAVANGDVGGALHHHRPGGANGTVHCDFNAAWFADVHDADGINLTDSVACDYLTGRVNAESVRPRETVRSAAMLFYLCNGPWNPSDGGATGLYARAGDDAARPRRAIGPVDNSLVAFACTPSSFHTFTANRAPRSSVIVWLHQPKAAAVERWGAESIERWT